MDMAQKLGTEVQRLSKKKGTEVLIYETKVMDLRLLVAFTQA